MNEDKNQCHNCNNPIEQAIWYEEFKKNNPNFLRGDPLPDSIWEPNIPIWQQILCGLAVLPLIPIGFAIIALAILIDKKRKFK